MSNDKTIKYNEVSGGRIQIAFCCVVTDDDDHNRKDGGSCASEAFYRVSHKVDPHYLFFQKYKKLLATRCF